MPRKPANPKADPAKKTTRKKKAAPETAAEITETPVMDAPTAEAPKKRGRKPAEKKAEPVVETTVAEVNAAPVAEESAHADAPEKKARKPRAKKEDKKTEPVLITTLQIGDAEFDISDIAAKTYKAYKSTHKRKIVTEFRVYVKPEENAAYYTVNGEGSADFKIDLS